MRLDTIDLRGWRSYGERKFEFDGGVNLIVGENARGKTNLLEAVSFLGSGKSFRTQKNAELVKLNAEFCDLEGKVFSQDRDQTLRWVIFPGRQRQIWLNGV